MEKLFTTNTKKSSNFVVNLLKFRQMTDILGETNLSSIADRLQEGSLQELSSSEVASLLRYEIKKILDFFLIHSLIELVILRVKSAKRCSHNWIWMIDY